VSESVLVGIASAWGTVLASGDLTMAELRKGSAAACTLRQRTEMVAPGLVARQSELPTSDKPLSFLVEVERHTVDLLSKYRVLRPDESQDLLAILGALKRFGIRPNISRSA
jgi:hypothetical protein